MPGYWDMLAQQAPMANAGTQLGSAMANAFAQGQRQKLEEKQANLQIVQMQQLQGARRDALSGDPNDPSTQHAILTWQAMDPAGFNAFRSSQHQQAMAPYEEQKAQVQATEDAAKAAAQDTRNKSGQIVRLYGAMQSPSQLPRLNRYLVENLGVDPKDLAALPEEVGPTVQMHHQRLAAVEAPEYNAESKDAFARFMPTGTPPTPENFAKARAMAEKEKTEEEIRKSVSVSNATLPNEIAIHQAMNPSFGPGAGGPSLSLSADAIKKAQDTQLATEAAKQEIEHFNSTYGGALPETQSLRGRIGEKAQKIEEALSPGSNASAVSEMTQRESDLKAIGLKVATAIASARGVGREAVEKELEPLVPQSGDSAAVIAGKNKALIDRMNREIATYQGAIVHGTSLGKSAADVQLGQRPGGAGRASPEAPKKRPERTVNGVTKYWNGSTWVSQ